MKKNSVPFQKSIEESLSISSGIYINERWMEFKQIIVNSAKKEIGYEKRERKKKPWITEEMIVKMDECTKWKSRHTEEGQKQYKKLNNELRR